jgi:NTP pyrophosphatase (non-canonical NTP hydrolase)
MNTSHINALNELAEYAYAIAKSKGFHDAPVSIATHCANLHGEVSELWEAYRRQILDFKCDKPIDLTCAEEELADIIIRALDMSMELGIDIGNAVKVKSEYNMTRSRMNGGKIA